MNETSSIISAEGAEVSERFHDYLSDESRLQGHADRISFPRNETDLVAILREATTTGIPITFSGARTGITGGAVPQAGWLVSLTKMQAFLGLRAEKAGYLLRCQPGLTLEAINHAIAGKTFEGSDNWSEPDRQTLERFAQAGPFLFPPDPTEQTASLGGMVACNASGARTLQYGATREYVHGMRVVLADGEILDLRRGREKATANREYALTTAGGRQYEGVLPAYPMPAVKNAAGYYADADMDMIDLFIGSEGTLGAFSEIEIALVPAPDLILGVIAFFDAEPNALDFVLKARDREQGALPVKPLAIEFFDANTVRLLKARKEELGPSAEIPELPPNAHTAIYIEIPTSEQDMEKHALALLELIDACGADPDNAWTATTEQETERLKAFRHAVPEAVNQRVGERAAQTPGLTKLGTDFAVPDNAFAEMLQAYRTTLEAAKLEYVIFGHVGNNHVHANILPRTLQEYETGKRLYLELATKAVALGGTVSGEHGIGKLKTYLLPLMYGQDGIDQMRAVKQVFDPNGLLNPGNVLATTGDHTKNLESAANYETRERRERRTHDGNES